MKKHVFFVLFTFITTFLIYSCSKDEHKIDTNDEPSSIDVRSGKQGYIEHTPEEIAYIHTIKSKVDAQNHFDLGADFENIKGLPDWHLAAVPYRSSGVFKSLLVPIIKGDKINAIFHVFDGSELTYYYIDESLLNEPFYCIVGPGLPLYESILDFYTNLLTNTPLDPDGDYDNTIDIPEMGGCTQITQTAVQCTGGLNHMPGEFCRCGTGDYNCDIAYWIQSTDQIDCGLNETSTTTNVNYNPIQGPGPSGGGGNNNNNGNNNTDPNVLLAYQYLYSVCPIISNEACIHLEFIVENVDNSIQCYLGIPLVVANLLEDPSPANIAAANCYIMNTDVQQYPSAPNTCSNPFSDAPLSEFAEMYGEMNSGLVSWGSTYPGLDNIPCELTVEGYTSDEKNQILQAFKDYLGNPQGIGLGDTDPPSNPEMDKVNELNAIFSNSYYPELIAMIPFFLDNPQHIPFIEEFWTKVSDLVDEYELNENNYFSLFDFNCVYEIDFETCAKYSIADDADDCSFELIWCTEDSDTDVLPNKVSPNSFNFKSTGFGWTCQVNSVVYKYSFSFGLTKIIHKIGDFCIQVPSTKVDGTPMTKTNAQNKMALAWELAESATQTAYVISNHSWGQIQYKTAFLLNLEIAMIDFFPGTFGQGSMSVQNQACFGNISGRSLKYF